METPGLGRVARLCGAATVAVGGVAFVFVEAAAGANRALIPTTVGLIIAHHKRGDSGDGDGIEVEVEPSHPLTAFLWGAVNDGRYDDVDLHIGPDLSVRLNGHAIGPEDLGGQGPIAFAETLDSWRALVPDLRWTLLDEVVGKDKGTVALRFEVSGTHSGSVAGLEATGNHLRYEVAAFLRIEDKRLHGIDQFVDLQELSAALGSPAD